MIQTFIPDFLILQQRNDERKANMTLTEDLVKERMKSEEISESLDGLHKQLKQVGLGKLNS